MLKAVQEYFSIETVIWLLPVIFMFHNLEEIITIESFMEKYKNKVSKSFLAKLVLDVRRILGAKSNHFSVTTTWILFILSLISFRSAYLLPIEGNFLLFVAALNVFFLQAFSHISQTIIFRSYTPGVITAVFAVIPYSLFTYAYLFEMGFINGHLLIKSIPISITMVPIFLIGGYLGRRIVHPLID
ncbi:HXXEE domain-containing protein [Cytobacillus depressus]|uniref:HXXEE domain-containing protein n=1 Tax=Cytobacillus depressus TaxID=1602942 RepID=A0A6L3V7V1_9BACI|nr:HXXEE domain-containing protein [Cytobacillus depressus]KAB2336677.1 HXXEE domain-containing protein [Cytobacillus depressus]